MVSNQKISAENYERGFLIDAEWMGGIAKQHRNTPDSPQYCAYIVNLLTQEAVGSHVYPTLEQALSALNAIQRPWDFVATTRCGEPGGCGGDCGTTCKKSCE